MTTGTNSKKEEYAKAVCVFLSEMLRVHRISLERAAEISQQVLDNLNLIDTETDFLKFIKTLSADFEELNALSSRMMIRFVESQRDVMEDEVREFVISIMGSDLAKALQVIELALQENTDVNTLTAKFPEFKLFVAKNYEQYRS